jgi:hypothetical protein
MPNPPRRDWSATEVAATVASYLAMLRLEYAGQVYSKTGFRRLLLDRLDGRTEASVEMKHRNISAVMIELGFLPIRGYKPLANYQAALVEEVLAQVSGDPMIDSAASAAVELGAEPPPVFELAEVLVAPPKPTNRVADPGIQSRIFPHRRDYVEREARNRRLGLAGELFVLEFEARRLHSLGKKSLSDRVEHVSKTRGDGLGYDVLSFDETGRELFMEVKTTANSVLTPFFISAGEVRFSKDNPEAFRLARVFDFREKPRMYIVPGAVDSGFTLNPVTFRASR